MYKRSIRNRMRLVLPALAALAVFAFGGLPFAPQTSSSQTVRRGAITPNFLARMAIPGTKELQLIIELSDPSVVQAMVEASGRGTTIAAATGQARGRLKLDQPDALAHRARIGRAQALMTERLRSLDGVQVQGSADLVMNAVIARVPIERYAEIRNLPGVRKVYFSRPQRKNLNAAAPLVNAPALWARVSGGRAGAGQGIKIGILDTGIDITNPMFNDTTTPLPAGYPKSGSGDAAYTNHKVIVARNYIGLLSSPQRVRTAVDEDGHGSFVAGCAAGILVNAPLAQISGMAPGAFLGNYKIFGTPGVNDTTTTAAVLAAINDAVNDGMEVLNLSLGATDFVPPLEDPEVVAIHNAIDAGLVVTLAAGNAGPDTHSISTPGSAPDAIAVGAVWNSRVFSAQLHVTGPGAVPANLQNIAYTNGTGPAISTAIPSTPLIDVSTLDGTGLACSALPAGSLNGNIALISRGTCIFADKVTNAANAGARAVVVYNHVAGDSALVMGGLSSTTIPAVMIFNAEGLALKRFVASNPGAAVSIDVSSNNQLDTPVTPVLAADSARGPSGDFGIKPDLVAVGWEVYSATQNSYPSSLSLYDASQFTISQGTSFSTPMVSGAAAALRQLFPSLTPAGIKSALANTANPVTIDGTTPATVVQAGNGLLDMGRSSAVSAVFKPTNLNFGVQAYTGAISLTQRLDINNISGGADQYTISVQPQVSGPSINLSASTTGSIPPGGSIGVDVTLQATAPVTGGFQGFIIVRSNRTSSSYSIPYWAGLYVPDPTRILTVSQSATGPNVFKNLNDALAAANPGNIIEFADSQTYTVPNPTGAADWGFSVSTNAQGLPLHGITIRAAAGQTPVIDGSGTSATANIQVVGLRKVLIQGLTITGGETGIALYQPSSSVPLSVTIDHCKISNTTASSTAAGILVENGGDVAVTYSTISGSAGTGIVAANRANLTISGTTIQGNQYDGIEATDSNVDLIGSTISGNVGVGAYLENCSGTLAQNTFTGNTGPFGDGIEVGDGTMTITANTFSGNDSAGIYLFAVSTNGAGPTVVVERNTIKSNKEYGLQSDQVKDLRMTGNMITDNGIGFYSAGTSSALLRNNIIARSTSATAGNGIDVGESTVTNVVNNTVYGNRFYGIARSGTGKITVYNTIISSNTRGDLSGLSSGQVQYSFVGDGTLPGGANLQGNPGLRNPAADDFSLAPGSPAIDAGSSSVAHLPFLDYNQQLRVASSSALPGAGLVDMGAIEAGSTYPLNYPLLVSGNSPALGDSFITGFAALNTSASSSDALFSAYGGTGVLLGGTKNPSAQTFAAGAQFPILDFQLFGFPQAEAKTGAVLASSLQKLVGFFLIFDKDFSRMADGVDVSADTWTDFYFMRHQSDAAGQTTYQVFNPGVNPANINAALVGSTGVQLDVPKVNTIPAKGQYTFSFSAAQLSSGYVHVQSDRPVAGLEVYGNNSEIATLNAVDGGTEARLFFPHIAVNAGYTSFLGVVNTSASPADLVLTAYGNDGSILGSPAQRILNARGQLLESAYTLFGLSSSAGLITGYVIVASNQPGITGFCAFNFVSGAVQSHAAVPAQSVPQKKLLFSHVAHQWPAGSGGNYLTGVALLNPYGTTISYTMRVFNGGGTKVAELSDVLGPHEKVAKLLSHSIPGAGFFTQTLPLGNGYIEVTTDYQLLGFELFFTESLTQLAAVMAQFPDR